MSAETRLKAFGSIPFSHGALLPLLAEYQRPNDKIARWLATGVLVQLRRGLYVLGSEHRPGPVSLPLLAHLLYGPSCVSLDFALSWHGIIPERVVEISSVCTRRARVINTPMGRFSYTHLPHAAYGIGIRIETNQDGSSFLMAGPEKALCDKVALTRHLDVSGKPGMQAFLFEDLRVEPEALALFDREVIRQYAQAGYKSRQLLALYRVVESLQCP